MKIKCLSIAALLIAGTANAATIEFLDVPTHVNDGSFYDLPYQISIDGTSQLVTCYDIFDDVNFGDTWQAQLLTLNQASVSGYFSSAPSALAKYERVAWLDSQQYQTTAQQIGLQYSIWDVFGTYRTTAESLSYDVAANAAASTGYAGFDFSLARFIEEPDLKPGQAGTKQAFVFWEPPGTGSLVLTSTPEPESILLSLLAICCVALPALYAKGAAAFYTRTVKPLPGLANTAGKLHTAISR